MIRVVLPTLKICWLARDSDSGNQIISMSANSSDIIVGIFRENFTTNYRHLMAKRNLKNATGHLSWQINFMVVFDQPTDDVLFEKHKKIMIYRVLFKFVLKYWYRKIVQK